MRVRSIVSLLITVLAIAIATGSYMAFNRTNGTGVQRTTSSPLVDLCRAVSQSEEVDCYTNAVLKAYNDAGLEAAATIIEAASNDRTPAAGRFAARCHDVAHNLGRAIDLDVEADLERRGPSTCRSGFFHGVHAQKFASVIGGEGLSRVAGTICAESASIVAVGSGGVGNGCRHALGHEFILRGLDASTAARSCTQLPMNTDNVESAIEDCLHGVYMEVFLAYEATEGRADPTVVCTPAGVVSKAALLACIGEAGLSLFRLGFDTSPRTAFGVCRTFASDAAVAESCAAGLGRAAAAFMESSEVSIKQYCASAEDLYEPCLIFAVAAVMEAEHDRSWLRICDGLIREELCIERLEDIWNLVETGR